MIFSHRSLHTMLASYVLKAEKKEEEEVVQMLLVQLMLERL